MSFRTPVSLIAGLGAAVALAPFAVHAVDTASGGPVDLVGQVTRIRDADGDGRISAGDAVYYEFRVTVGGSDLGNVAVVSPLLGAVICPRTTLAAGAAMTCASHAPYVVTDADVQAGRFGVAVHAEGTDGGGAVRASPTVTVTTSTGASTSTAERPR